jgi:hypothetical protein
MTSRVHAIAGTLALALIALFFTSSVVVEMIGDHSAVALIKKLILFGVIVLVPAMIATGATGRLRARRWRGSLVRRKKIRMVVIAAIGLLVLIPCAVTLQRFASSGDFGSTFYVVQFVELAGGLTNIILMSLNVRSGMIMTGKIKRKPGRATMAVQAEQAVGDASV